MKPEDLTEESYHSIISDSIIGGDYPIYPTSVLGLLTSDTDIIKGKKPRHVFDPITFDECDNPKLGKEASILIEGKEWTLFVPPQKTPEEANLVENQDWDLLIGTLRLPAPEKIRWEGNLAQFIINAPFSALFVLSRGDNLLQPGEPTCPTLKT